MGYARQITNTTTNIMYMQWSPWYFSDKNGVSTSKVSDLVNLIRTKCTELEFKGLMTIGSFDHSLADGVNPDFVVS